MARIAVASRHLARGARFVVPLALTAGCLWLVRQQVGDDMPAALPASLSGIGAVNILLALGCVAIGFWAVGRYDGLSHRHFGTRVPPRVARLSGTMAIALAQTLGFGVITGALVRHRLLPGLGFRRALQLSVFVSLSFLAAWLWITALACVVLPAPGWTTLPAMVALAGLPLCTGLMAFGPRPRKARWRAALPTLTALGAILLWAALDLLAAALVLYLLIPAGTLGFGSFVPVFLLAYGAGLLSGAPGGVGPFELVLLSLLPQVPDAMLIGAIMGYRGLYYALPAVLGALALLRPLTLNLPTLPAPRPHGAGRAELGLLRQNGGRVARLGGRDMALWRIGQALVVLPGAAPLATVESLTALQRQARQDNRLACLYKCTAREAALARSAGWQVLRIAQEALMDPQTFDLHQPACRGLRRKLRQAAKAGVLVQQAGVLPLGPMAAIDACWQRRNGPARGGTMGRFCPDYIAGQQVFLAWQDDRLLGFASFHAGAHDRALDLMRLSAEAPAGTMQALVIAALEAARAAGSSGFSLAAVPDIPALAHPLLAPTRAPLLARAGAAGLRQFKSGFAPHWSPRYVAAPSRAALALCLADLTREIHHPPALAGGGPLHEGDEEYELAPGRAA
ncbi:hypothetical protein GCM10007928_26750 [Sulfitobacter porphyrae]|nr:hypothetical protein GCM10007928_26750 [Sulfitobacter porphyrae]